MRSWRPTPRSKFALGTAAVILPLLMTANASAVTAELARKCGALAEIAYPLRVPGNPAAGRTHGTAQDFRDYFNKCVANRGNMGEQAPRRDSEAPSQVR
jgi:hypothetical protein